MPRDTTIDAEALQMEAYRQMGLIGRLRIATELSDLVHVMAVAGIRRRNPELSQDEARRELAESLYTTSI
jgi:hypothetical protein